MKGCENLLTLIELKQAVLRKYFSSMNDNQFRAVVQTEGHLLLFAGAGSGKTTVLVNRTVNLIRFGNAFYDKASTTRLNLGDIQNLQNYLTDSEALTPQTLLDFAVSPCDPKEIMAITFTNKAAKELKARISTALGAQGCDVCAKTFHSLGAEILRKCGTKLGYDKAFSIYDTDDSKMIIVSCIKEFVQEYLNGKYLSDPFWSSQDPSILKVFISDLQEKPTGSASDCMEKISLAKDKLIDAESFCKLEANTDDLNVRLCTIVYKKYQKILYENNAMDFGDLLLNVIKLFSLYPNILAYYQNKYRYIMVDEYQDTNIAQFEIVKFFEGQYHNLCVVGDDDQSIYKFRGAEITNILNFPKYFSSTNIIKLEQNYRSTQNILFTANGFIKKNLFRASKTMWTQNILGAPIIYVKSDDAKLESEFISKTICQKIQEGAQYQDFAILYRINSLAKPLEPSLLEHRIPYFIYHGSKLSDSKIAKDIIAYLRFIDNPADSIQLKRILNTPKRGLGAKVLSNIFALSEQENCSAIQIIKNASLYPTFFKKSTIQKLSEFSQMIESFRTSSPKISVQELYASILKNTGYLEFLENSVKKEKDRYSNANIIRNLYEDIRSYEQQLDDISDSDLTEYLEWTTLSSSESEDCSDRISLMSIHSAKGLEFSYVFLVGFDRGLIPFLKTDIDIFTTKAPETLRKEKMEEERRLAYVAFTRAKNQLYLCSCKERTLYGKTCFYSPSEFAYEIPTNNLKFSLQKRPDDSHQKINVPIH